MKPHRSYQLQEYDPGWNEKFLTIAEKLRPLFTDNLVTIEHVGSTSIEGMFAKPQIDILVVVKDLSLVKSYYTALTDAGFIPRGTEYVGIINDEYVTEDAPDGTRIASIHILPEGHPEIKNIQVFRDYLRANKEDRDLYIATKKELYFLYPDNYAEYDNGKREVISGITDRANKWVTNLQGNTSD